MIRRLFVAVLALVLSVTVLAVSPASAANTAVESLSDHDNNAATAQVREFGGANRYATSVALAEAFRANSGSGGFVDTVIVASGESLVDAAAAAGLAASEIAPVLLTPPGRLQRAVENFIVDEFVSEVFIVGGTASVSQAVEDAIGELAPVRTVTRLAGADRYGTAVAVANEIGTPGVYCDTGQVTALLVNVDSSFSDVIATGPLAYSLELPILLTPTNALPASVAGYLTDAEIERVVVVGGTTAVSAAVVADINEAGVEDVVRISGANRYDTALEIRQALSDCETVTLSPTTFALVNAEAAADGVAAGPLLGLGLANNGVTPVLLVDSGDDNGGLPADTRDFLRSLPIRNADASFVDVSLTAIGGAAVVPESVVQAAIAAATTSPPITATITATAGADSFRVTFSAPVDVSPAPVATATAAEQAAQRAAFATSALNRVNYQVSGGPLVPGDTFVASNNNRTITIGLSGDEPLLQNAPISVVDGKIKGFGGDNRRVEGAQATARVLPDDRVRPRIEVFAPQGSHAIRIQVTEPNLATDVSTQTDDDDAVIGAAATTTARNNLLAAVSIRPASGAASALYIDGATTASIAAVLPSSAQNDITVCLFGMTGVSGSEVCNTAPNPTPAVDDGNPRAQEALKTGETITIAAGAFQDNQGNPSRSTSQRVTSYSNYPRVTRATVTSATTLDVAAAGADPDPQVAQWRWLRYDAATPPEVARNVLTITAKPGGAAGGAGGNDWRVSWVQLPADNDTEPEATVSVNERRKIILINFDEDATIFTVAGALASNPAFSELFTVNSDAFVDEDFAIEKITAADNLLPTGTSVTPCSDAPVADGVCGRPSTDVSRALSGGVSVVAVTLTYNETLNSFNYAGTADTTGTAGLIATNENADTFPSQQRTVPGTRGQRLILGWQPDPFTADLDLDNEFRFLLTTDSATLDDLPKPGNRISLPAGLGETFAFVNDTPTDPLCPSGLSANSDDDPCGRSIAAITPGQTLRRSTTSGRIEGSETIVLNAIATTVRTTGEGAQTFMVSFAEAVNDESDDTAAAFATSAANPAHYLISSAALPATATIALSADSLTATITLPAGSELALGDTIAVVGGSIAAASTAGLLNGAVEVVVTATGVEPATPITATITATVGGRAIAVRFSEPVNGAASGTDGFATSALNLAHYQIDGAEGESLGTVVLSANGLVADIVLFPGRELADGAVVSVVGGQIKAATDERRVQAVTTTIRTATSITATIEPLVAGARIITVRFSEPVNGAANGTDGFASSALNSANYRIDRVLLRIDPGGSIVLSDNDMTATITLSTDLELFESQRFVVEPAAAFSSTGIKAAGANDDRRVDFTQIAVGPAPTTRITAAIAAQANSNTISVDFSEPVSSATSGTGARNPAHYQIDGAALPGITTIALSSNGLAATITLPAGSEVSNGAVITIAGGEISVAAASDDRRVAAAEFTVGTLITAIIEPVAASRGNSVGLFHTPFTVEFSERVNSALPGEAGYANSARNPANYQIDGVVLGTNSDTVRFVSNIQVASNIRVTLTLVAREGQVISVVGGAIKAENASDSRTVEAAEVTVGPQLPLVAAIEARAGEQTITVDFSDAVRSEMSGEDGFANSANNPDSYQIDGNPLPTGTTITSQFSRAIITLPASSELINGAVISVVGGEIQASDPRLDSRTVEATSFTVGTAPTLITATISAEAGGRAITVVFSEGVEGSLSGSLFTRSARNPAYYQIDDAPLPEGTFITLTPDGITATIALPVGEELAEGAVISIPDNVLITAARVGFIFDGRPVEATTFTVPAS